MTNATATTQRPPLVNKSDRYVINISLGNDNEPAHVFVGGCPEGDFRIERGKDVSVPKSVLIRLNDAIIGVPEPDPSDPENRLRIIDRKRFPYTIVKAPASDVTDLA